MRLLKVINFMLVVCWLSMLGFLSSAAAGDCDLIKSRINGDASAESTTHATDCARSGDVIILDDASLTYGNGVDWTLVARSVPALKIQVRGSIERLAEIFASHVGSRYVVDVTCYRFHTLMQSKNASCHFKSFRPDKTLLMNAYLFRRDPKEVNVDQINAGIELSESTIDQLIVGEIEYSKPLRDGLVLNRLSITSNSSVKRLLLSNSIFLGDLKIENSHIDMAQLTNVLIAGNLNITSSQLTRADFSDVFVLGKTVIANDVILDGSLTTTAFNQLDEHDNKWDPQPPGGNAFLKDLRSLSNE